MSLFSGTSARSRRRTWIVWSPLARVGPQRHLALVVEIQPVEGDSCGETRRAGGAPDPLPAFAPPPAEFRVLVEVPLTHVDQRVLVGLGAPQHALELLDKGFPPLRVGP